jgi:hypothetical protein
MRITKSKNKVYFDVKRRYLKYDILVELEAEVVAEDGPQGGTVGNDDDVLASVTATDIGQRVRHSLM